MKCDRIEKIEIGTITLIIIIVFAFLVNNPNPDFELQIVDFSLDETNSTFRTGYPIKFKWETMGFLPQVDINWGDGNVETITNNFNKEDGGLFKFMTHTYLLQGKYSPKLQIWDYQGKEYSKFCELSIQNDNLQFYINITPSHQIFEDDEVLISVENVFELNKDLRSDIENLTYFYDFGDSQLTSDEEKVNYKWKNEGQYPLTISIIDSQGTISRKTTSIEIENKSPEAYFPITNQVNHQAQSKIEFSAERCIDTESDKNTLLYLWNWGDNTASWGKISSHIYPLPGNYDITLHVIDDNGARDSYSNSIIIHRTAETGSPTNPSNTDDNYPYIAIGTLPNEVFEDEQVQFISEIELQEGNINDYASSWRFGDDVCSFERNPLHSWTQAGVYNIELKVIDVNGNEYLRYEKMTVNEKPPEILGPFSFQGIEGKAIDLDVEVYDALLDVPYLRYKWYDEKDQLFSTNKKPSVILEDGSYKYTLEVIDPSDSASTSVVDILVHPISPDIYIPNFAYYGNDPGSIELRAYCYDNVFDTLELDFYWTISNGKIKQRLLDVNNGNYSKVIFECYETTVYQGQVRVNDRSDNERVITFQIFSYIDNPIDDENNEILNEFLDLKVVGSQDSTIDTDGDHLSDQYETEVSNTYINNPDSDGDGLWDGYDNFGIGEKILGTSPSNPDSDGDGLNDGLEYFGYMISINYFENASTIRVSSDPLRTDTEEDGLTDFEEYEAKTNPRLSDSDGDQLSDREDPYPTTWDHDQDLLSDYMEFMLGTDINNTDSDKDGIKDGEEVNGWGIMQFQTDPTRSDTDMDFAIDSAELKNYKISLEDEYGKDIRMKLTEPVSLFFPQFFKKAATAQISFALSFGEQGSDDTQAYGIDNSNVLNLDISIIKTSDNVVLYNSITQATRHFSQVVDITDIMNDEQLGLNYYGDYTLEVKEVNGNSVPKCLLEQFELDFTRYLDPNNEDFDGDGIFDGVEMDLLVKGIDKIDIRDFYDGSDKGIQYQNEDINEFSLEIPDRGRVYDANIMLQIESGNALMGKGNISINLIKKINLWEREILTYQENFDIYDNFHYERTIDISNLGSAWGYSGEYVLEVKIHDNHPNDTFYISEFYIETDTYVQAGHQDTQAWLTDPALFDTDSDGWSDYYEISTSETNPLNKDTDGDKAWDSNDRDPLRNVILEIRPISGTFKNQIWLWSPPVLEVITRFHINDLLDPDFSEDRNKILFCSKPKMATTDPIWFSFQTAWWNEGEGTRYYFDVNDDINIQSNTIPFYFQLWEMLDTGDVPIFAGAWLNETYSINNVGHWEELMVQMNGDKIRCQVETIAIERANTIAIFESNGTSFTGHYNNEERLNIIQLNVTEDGQHSVGIPFKPGPNIIVIPTSLFEKTLLNSYLQNEQLEKTPLYTTEEGLFEFYSIDRDGNIVDDQCGDTDFLFVRYNISPNEAMEVLNSLLTCAVNQSLDENNNTITELVKVYEYVSTKLNNISAVSLNLPKGLMSFIPLFSNLKNSSFGRIPVDINYFGILLTVLLTLVIPMSGLVMIALFTLAIFSNMFAKIAETIGLVILTFLANLLWILIRAALLILFFILLAIEILTTTMLIIPLGLALMGLGGLMGISSNWGLNWCVKYGENTRIGHLQITMNDMIISIESWINWVYWEFFDLYIPLPDLDMDFESTLYHPSTEPEPPTLHCGYKQLGDVNSTKFNFYTVFQDQNGDKPNFVKLHLLVPNGSTLSYNMTSSDDYDEENFHITGIEYNLTVDFLNEMPGQWLYYFTAEEDSNLNSKARWPIEYYYEPGPFISENNTPEDFYRYFLMADVDHYFGTPTQTFNFTVMGGDFLYNQIPDNVFLNILWENGTIQPFLMEESSSMSFEIGEGSTNRNITFTTYSKGLEFNDYLGINEIYIIRSYYTAEFQNGNISILFDNYEDKFYNDAFNLTSKKWFDSPCLIPQNPNGKPTILGWKVQAVRGNAIYDSTSSLRSPIGPIMDEEVLRFWVFISDPDGDHIFHRDQYGFEFKPKLILKNLDSPYPLESIDMVWAGKNNDPYPNCDAYFIDVLPVGLFTFNHINYSICDFGPGVWTFNFFINDQSGNRVNQKAGNGEKYQKIWLIGSSNRIWDTAFNGYDTSGNHIDTLIPGAGLVASMGVSIAFFATALLSMMGPSGQTAARYISYGILAFDIINSFIGLGVLLGSRDTGALLGMCLGALISTVGISLAHSLGGATSSKIRVLNLGNLNIMAKIAKYTFLVNLILTMICNPTVLIKTRVSGYSILPGVGNEFDWDLPGEEVIRRVPGILSSFLLSVLSLGAILNIAEMKFRAGIGFSEKSSIVAGPVMKATKCYPIAKIIVALVCFIGFVMQTGMVHVIGDYLADPSAIIFGG